jgi:hypothetical protein
MDAQTVLSLGLADLELALELGEYDFSGYVPRDAVDAVLLYVWHALGDPRGDIRWRAKHAMRFYLTFGVESVSSRLNRIATEGGSSSYRDEELPFYAMHAQESLLVVIERALLDGAGDMERLLPFLIATQEGMPQHVRCGLQIHRICELLEQSGQGSQLDQLWLRTGHELGPSVELGRYQRARIPKPYQLGAPSSRYQIHFDLDEQWVAGLTESFDVSHEEVLDMISVVVIDEWNHVVGPRGFTTPVASLKRLLVTRCIFRNMILRWWRITITISRTMHSWL